MKIVKIKDGTPFPLEGRDIFVGISNAGFTYLIPFGKAFVLGPVWHHVVWRVLPQEW
ncbi:hypothetical protein [Xanthovirga aplysinae]|uniref:hypothetical protein n=1 Tax=Xanthovirga aplysinae TaxID=2529853 RepID=UPI0012BBE34C|nr:hypothetical protein [Xanthovirga aplysinae]